MLVLKISDKGFMVNQHSKTLLNPNLNFNFIERYNGTFFIKNFFLEKDSCAFVAVMGAELSQLPCRVIVGGF